MSDISDVIGDVDLSTIPAAEGFDPIPAGWYPVEIENAEIKATKSGTGKYIKLAMVVLGDECAGRKLFSNLNIQNPNPKAVEIAMRELAAIGQALGLISVKDCAELIGAQLMAKVAIRKEEGRDPDNEVKGYKAIGEAPAAPAKPAPAAKPAAKPAATAAATPKAAGKRPWEK
jgi:hypothetical protein